MRRREDADAGISGGRFVPAAEGLLPPIRNTKIQGGRFVPAANELLPPVRTYQVGIDYENAYHFGNRP
jgi:hypothetical protein